VCIVGLVSVCAGLILQLADGGPAFAQSLIFVGAGISIGSGAILALMIRYRIR